ncbi:hypothetical protein [Microbulbifer sp. GL-2]|uniref:hypothetical protein n=1 Tax=Microbulbifer sp. GL-2 TaxID=2591606 RepID=UPI001165208D|nr:hypothetical protein [Microbulbifer sp. GL-2]BBM00449.1 hypothetical protein GL2_05230 [Microbulbifer sp. GL-2]
MADSQLISKIDHSHRALPPAQVQQLREIQYLNMARQRILEWPDSPVKNAALNALCGEEGAVLDGLTYAAGQIVSRRNTEH